MQENKLLVDTSKDKRHMLYEENLNMLRIAKKQKEPNQEEIVQLIVKAMGTRSLRGFAEEMRVNPSTISRTLSGKVQNTSLDLLAKIAAYAAPESGVTIEKCMEASGLKIQSGSTDLVERLTYCTSIVVNELRKRGYTAHYMESDVTMLGKKMLNVRTVRTNALTGDESDWQFSASFGVPKLGRRNLSNTDFLWNLMAQYYLGTSKITRSTLIFSNESDYLYHKDNLSKISIPDEISIILISEEEKQIIEEYIAPQKDGKQAVKVFE